MKRLWLLLLWIAPALAAINGTVVNGTTGELLPGAVVALHELGRQSAAPVARVKSDAHGRFSINRETVGPHLVRTFFDGVGYESILPLGTNAESVTLVVYRSSKQAGAAGIRNHTVRFEPASGGLMVREVFEHVNEGAVTWNDARGETLRFYLPPSAEKVVVNANPPGGTPASQAAARTAARDIYQVGFPVRPGQTLVSVTYVTDKVSYHGEIGTPAEATLLSAASGYELSGSGMRQSGSGYLVVGNSYDVALTAKPDAHAQKVVAAVVDEEPKQNGPVLERVIPRISRRAPALLMLMFAVFGLGFVRLYRQET